MSLRQMSMSLLAGAALLGLLSACVPTCTEAELQAPVNLDPNSDSDILDPDELAGFTWGYPTSDCEPDFFEMYVWTGIEPASPGGTGQVNYDDEVSPGSWHMWWPIPLEPGNTYYWRQAACLEIGPGDDPCGPSALGHFFTGPVCAAADVMQPVNLIAPEDEATFAAADDVQFAWDDPTPCLVSYMFWIQISEDPEFNEYLRRIPLQQSVFTVPGEEIPLEDCHRYYWRIQTDPAGMPEEPYSAVRSFFVRSPGVLCTPSMEIEPPPLLTPIAEPIATLVPELVPTLVSEPSAQAPQDTNCRAGPSTRFRVDDTLFAGVPAPLRGRNADATWLQILSPNLQRLCWIWAGQAGLEIVGDVGTLPEIYVAEPTEVPVDCTQYSTKDACNANSACKWEQLMSAANVGKCVPK